ncbi:MAG: NADH-quinone oxidoreductase subunit L [Firmicutes bacterium]|nr:NADH-quinone oxidoreductase subunit L [Bacillota bacterium]
MEITFWLLVGIPVLPLLGAAATAALRRRASRGMLAAIACSAVALAFACTVAALIRFGQAGGEGVLHAPLWSWGVAGVGLGLIGDSISIWFSLVVTGVGLLIHIYAAGYMADDPDYGRFFAKLNYFIFAMSLLVLADGFVGMLMGWANVGLASYLLIGFWNRRPAAAAAAKKAFWVNTVGEVGLILAMLILLTSSGSLRFADVLPQAGLLPPEVLNAAALLLLVGAVAKSAQLPLFVWLPDAMQGPTPVSALIHAATMVTAGVYLVVRAFPLFEAAPWGMPAVALVGVASAVFGAVAAMGQNDIKRILAYSTMSQVGYMMLAAGVGAYAAALFHFMTHAFFKALLFLGAGLVIHHFHGEQDVRRMGGLGRESPFVYWTFLIGTLALVGAPPLAGFFSKDEIVVELLAGGHTALWVLAVAAAGLTAFYMLRLFCLVFAGNPYRVDASDRGPAEAAAAAEHDAHSAGVPAVQAVPVLLLTILSIAGGWLWVPGLTHVPEAFFEPALARYGSPAPVHAGPVQAKEWTMGALLLVSAAGAAWAVKLFGKSRRADATGGAFARAAEAGFGFDAAYRAAFVEPLRALAGYAGRVMDPQVVDGAVNGIARLAGTAALALGRLHGGFVRRYALVLVTGVTAVLIYFLMAV